MLLRKPAIVNRPAVPWYSDDITAAKQRRRLLERQWRKSGLQVHREMFKAQRDLVKGMFVQAKSRFYNDTIQNCGGDQKTLFKVINQLMHKKISPVLPPHSSDRELACNFSDYFVGKSRQSEITFCLKISILT